MKPLVGLIAALAIAGCQRNAAADVTLDADADARNATQAKIFSDLAAADAAARAPMPRVAPSPITPAAPRDATAPADATREGGNDGESGDGNSAG